MEKVMSVARYIKLHTCRYWIHNMKYMYIKYTHTLWQERFKNLILRSAQSNIILSKEEHSPPEQENTYNLLMDLQFKYLLFFCFVYLSLVLHHF